MGPRRSSEAGIKAIIGNINMRWPGRGTEMTDASLSALMTKVTDDVIEVYRLHCDRAPKVFIVAAMAGALASCASEAGIGRKMIEAVLNSAFDDIEAGEQSCE